MKKGTSQLILSLETATSVCSVALHDRGVLISSSEHHLQRSHSAVLPQMVQHMCRQNNIQPTELCGVAIGEGPGSYTGLRIGTALGKGLCYGAGLPLLTISTLRVLAASARRQHVLPFGSLIYALLDARRGYAYGLLVAAVDGSVVLPMHVCHVTGAPFLSTQDDVYEGQPVYYVGSGIEAYRITLPSLPSDRILSGYYPDAKQLGYLAYEAFQQQQFADLAHYTPHYVSALPNPYVRS